MRTRLTACLFLIGSLTCLGSSAAAAISFGPLSVGDQSSYVVDYHGKFWQNTNVALSGVLTIALSDSTHADATWAGKENTTVAATVDTLGGINAGPMIEWLDAYNTVARTVHAMAASDLKAGDTWTAQIPVHVNPGEVIEVPVTATVAPAKKNAPVSVKLQGDRSGMYSYSGFIVPIDVSVVGTLQFENRRLVGSEFVAHERVHLGGPVQTLSWSWNLTPR